jgi:hypothetical protein
MPRFSIFSYVSGRGNADFNSSTLYYKFTNFITGTDRHTQTVTMPYVFGFYRAYISSKLSGHCIRTCMRGNFLFVMHRRVVPYERLDDILLVTIVIYL